MVLAAAVALVMSLWLLALILILIAALVFGVCSLLWPAEVRRRSHRSDEP